MGKYGLVFRKNFQLNMLCMTEDCKILPSDVIMRVVRKTRVCYDQYHFESCYLASWTLERDEWYEKNLQIEYKKAVYFPLGDTELRIMKEQKDLQISESDSVDLAVVSQVRKRKHDNESKEESRQ